MLHMLLSCIIPDPSTCTLSGMGTNAEIVFHCDCKWFCKDEIQVQLQIPLVVMYLITLQLFSMHVHIIFKRF